MTATAIELRDDYMLWEILRPPRPSDACRAASRHGCPCLATIRNCSR
jgi:hypothetical protein